MAFCKTAFGRAFIYAETLALDARETDEMSVDERTSAFGLFNYANSYRRSAEYLSKAKVRVSHPHAPITYLFYHAIELYLKSFLRSHGYSVAKS